MRLAAQFRAIYLFLLNKWYFDEFYDFALRAAARGLAARSGRSATRRSSTACRTALAALTLDGSRQA